MTCIVALKVDGGVLMGADSAGVSGWGLNVRKDPKIYEVGEFIFGFTSSFRMGQILGYKFNPPSHKENMTNFEYMVSLFVDELRTCLKEHGYSRNNNGEDQGGTFLVGYRGDIFCLQDDYQVAEIAHPYHAVGCGQDIALGSLWSTEYVEISDTERVEMALQAAETFSAGVRGPFIIKFKENPCNETINN